MIIIRSRVIPKTKKNNLGEIMARKKSEKQNSWKKYFEIFTDEDFQEMFNPRSWTGIFFLIMFTSVVSSMVSTYVVKKSIDITNIDIGIIFNLIMFAFLATFMTILIGAPIYGVIKLYSILIRTRK
jgi:hypothetical protein